MKVFYTQKMLAFAGEDSPSPRKPALVMQAWSRAGLTLEVEEPEALAIDDLALAHDRQHVEDILSLQKDWGGPGF